MTRRAPFRQADIARAIRAAMKAGLAVEGLSVRIEPGGAIEVRQAPPASAPDESASAMAEWRARRDARRAQGG